MYDRKTDSLWSQILGEAIVGEMTGTKLSVLPSDQIHYGDWKKLHPQGEITDEFAGKTIVVRYEEDIDAVRLFERKSDGTLERINPFPNFWFSWVAAHPDTELYK